MIAGFTGYACLLDDLLEVAPFRVAERLRQLASAPLLALVVALVADRVEGSYLPHRLLVRSVAHADFLSPFDGNRILVAR